MAEAREVASLGGYDDEFVNSVDEDLHCSICHLPLKGRTDGEVWA